LLVQSPAAVTKRWTLVLCCLAQFMVILDVSVVNVALPSIRDDLGFSVVDLQWVVNAYTITFAGFLLLGGRAADLLGPSGCCSPGSCCSLRRLWPVACPRARAS
jgi:MFS family permease